MPVADKPFKSKTERYEVDGRVVELIKMAPDLRRAYHGGPEPAVRSQWEIRVDGELTGYAVYPLGVGNPWEAYSLLPNIVTPWGWRNGVPESTLVRVWQDAPDGDAPGAWSGWTGRFYNLTRVGRDGSNSVAHSNGWTSREEIAKAWPAMLEAGKALTIQQVEARVVEVRDLVAEREAQKERDKVRFEREKAEAAAAQAKAAEEAELRRLETLEGLTSIRDRLGKDGLSNLEMLALGRAIERFGGGVAS